MLLLLVLIYPNTNKVSIQFDDGFSDFKEFQKVFSALKGVDNLCKKYLAYYKSQEESNIKVQSEVISLSKNSPFDLSVFVTDHWFEILLFILGSYDRVHPNAILIAKDSKAILSNVVDALKNASQEIRQFEVEKLNEVINWINSLSATEHLKIVKLMNRQYKVFRKIRSLKFGTHGSSI
jgi:hypothetical protein